MQAVLKMSACQVMLEKHIAVPGFILTSRFVHIGGSCAQQFALPWIGGQGTDPYEQNTQQSPANGFSLMPHPLQS